MSETFNPPYTLRARVAVAVGVWKKAPERFAQAGEGPREGSALDVVAGFRPVRLLGRVPALLLLADYLDPGNLPEPYREVIAACIARRGLRLAILPLDIRLDAPEPVDAGRKYYGLPKVLDPELSLLIHAKAVQGSASGFRFEAQALSGAWQAGGLVARALVTLGARVVTSLIPVVGSASSPPISAHVRLRQGELGRLARAPSARAAGEEMCVWLCHIWQSASVQVGRPSPLEGE